jgi:YidC/Oxa1 family membrane protein insertase
MLPEQDNQRNLVLAFALSLGVLMAWQFFYVAPRSKLEQEQKQLQAQQQAASQKQALPGAITTTPGQPGATTSTTAPQATTAPAATAFATREAAVSASPRLKIATPALIGSVNLKGGVIDDLAFVKYRETLKPDSANVLLLSPLGGPAPFFTEYGWLPVTGTTAVVPDSETIWKAQSTGALTPSTPVVMTFDNGQGLTFRRTISVDEKFMFTVKDVVENKTGRDVGLAPYARIYRFGTPKVEGWAILHEGMIGFIGDERLQEVTYADMTKAAETNLKEKKSPEATKAFKPAKGGWVGFTDKYWSAALIPPQDQTFDSSFGTRSKIGLQPEIYWASYQMAPIAIANGATGTSESHMFGGAKEVSTIENYAKVHNIERFDLMIDWGWFHFITKPLFWLIERLYGLLGNFGLAILAVTVFVKGVFFPLQNKSYESMAKMKKLQPEMERIKEQFKGDAPRQQQEMMKMYKDQKINPAAGCLPVLLQIPVFFALYKVLFVTIDMRHAPFFGWIKDLSAPDPTSLFNLFGLLPFAVPEFLHVGVWPLIMGATMWVQMQLNPQQPDPLQQKIFNWMPVMFTFMLASFPAGLVIYWAWSNLLSLAQQYYITKKNGAEVHLWKNLGLEPLIAKLKARKSGAKV